LSEKSQRMSNPVKGAIIALKSNSETLITESNSSTFIFQYNPEMLIRTIFSLNNEEENNLAKNSSNSTMELITLSLELDAVDKLEQTDQNKQAGHFGLHPDLAVLESIMSSQYEAISSDLLFLWGPNRILPIHLESVKIVEEAFDSNLNPIRTRIELCMRVRNLSELATNSIARSVYVNYLGQRRNFAKTFAENAFNKSHIETVHQQFKKEAGEKTVTKTKARSVGRISKLRKLS
jgi:hypothetical protein